jgi:hypothetical protein
MVDIIELWIIMLLQVVLLIDEAALWNFNEEYTYRWPACNLPVLFLSLGW